MTYDADQIAAAFNEGSDARIAGQPITSCPHIFGKQLTGLGTYWQSGWEDVEDHWAEIPKRKGIWYPPLKEVANAQTHPA